MERRRYTNNEKVEIFSVLVDQMVNQGKSVQQIYNDHKKEKKRFPDVSTLNSWCKENEEFSKDYAQAQKDRAFYYFDKIFRIAEQVLNGEVDPQAAKVAIDTYKWALARMDRQKYGDSVKIDQTVTERKNVADLFPDELKDEEPE